ncbi:YgcG family protein [Mucilaginibacter sp. BT774]|uniref:TPM domain-containing protein n=1 Tax=Mucilaginibacter sp. BT774 TaxID=3062276 RepID=UPI0026769C93|nr:TPM domain-containing protein [Mucilaginibacter sp. BT774]MDO3625494.1 TPM domain-containing protein [Mucilaginibacter sp. BT774]
MFKKILFITCLMLCTLLAFTQELPPKPNTLVTDFTNTLSDSEQQQLEHKLVAFDDSTSTQIAVVIMKSVGSYDINDYAQRLGRAWGIGQKGKNNGVVLLVAIGDRKVAIQTGYGVEAVLPDIVTHEIIQNDIRPNFKAGNYYAGLDAGTDDIIKYVKGEYKSDKKPQQQIKNGGSIAILIIIIVVILIIVFRNRGGGGQIIDSRGGASPFWWFLGGALLGRGSGSGGWGGFSGGDSGGDSGGGFGGFGGGDFGGGGSSGSW